jgi:hypothetical protein
MPKFSFVILFFSLLIFSACGPKAGEEEVALKPKTPVEVVNVQAGSVTDNIDLSATTIYLKRNMVTAQIPAFITKVNIHLGDKVQKGSVLYELESKERRALGKQGLGTDTSFMNFGLIKVLASSSGIITTLDKQQTGDYVLEGTQLCTIAESSDLAFQVNVPYEFDKFVKSGSKCTITLPDRSAHKATITTPLTAMNALAQTQIMLAKTDEALFLPENLIVKVQVSKAPDGSKQVLPKPCVLSDEMMQEFWIMKLLNDSTAVKVPVKIGNKNDKEIEILEPVLGKSDRIIINGNYGLSDTASVKITRPDK